MHPEISETARFPLLTPEGRRFLHAMRQHPQAPNWNWPNGEQLDAAGLERARSFAAALRAKPACGAGERPAWLPQFVDLCLEDVPFYRRQCPAGTPFHLVPSCTREDLAARPWEFVPDLQPLGQLIVFSSSGTTGHPAALPTHPATAACGIPLLEHALAPHGVTFPRGVDQVALAHVADYRDAYTTAIVVAYLEEAGCIRVNLQADAWRAPADCRAYLDRWAAPVLLGDPLSLTALEHVGIERQPRALLSSIMALPDALAAQLSARFACPVLDLYALTEAGIVAVRTPEGHRVLPHDLYVEILDEHDEASPPGVRGEVVLTGGRNPFCPLLRFRTGDFAALSEGPGGRVLIDLEGRAPVVFRTPDDRGVPGIEVSRALRRFPLVQFQLSQLSRDEFRFGYRGIVNEHDLRDVLQELLGRSAQVEFGSLPPPAQGRIKVRQYCSAVV